MSGAAVRCDYPRNVGRPSRRAAKTLRTCLCRKTRRGARRDKTSRRRRARRFANLDLYLSRQFPSAVSVPPAHGTVPKLPCGSRPRLSEAKGSGVRLDANTTALASQLEREYFPSLHRSAIASTAPALGGRQKPALIPTISLRRR